MSHWKILIRNVAINGLKPESNSLKIGLHWSRNQLVPSQSHLSKGIVAAWIQWGEEKSELDPVRSLWPNLATTQGRASVERSLVLTFPERHLSCIDHMRCDSLSHFKGEATLTYGFNKGPSIDVLRHKGMWTHYCCGLIHTRTRDRLSAI